ncbi:hypothetical protein NDU88_002021 [Pleurodeles waltl]|uniref:Uncharacterized protein n=1 Tax=Pleurodeles waltl TaxID=8319 RepID=A0AAV7P5M5_PLEWA|nr:hypothetical protein NDU88_002021 [Pleurodeles waltl]
MSRASRVGTEGAARFQRCPRSINGASRRADDGLCKVSLLISRLEVDRFSGHRGAGRGSGALSPEVRDFSHPPRCRQRRYIRGAVSITKRRGLHEPATTIRYDHEHSTRSEWCIRSEVFDGRFGPVMAFVLDLAFIDRTVVIVFIVAPGTSDARLNGF